MTHPAPLIQPALSEPDILRCFPVLQQLRPQLQLQNFLAAIRRQQTDGYILLMLVTDEQVAAVAGCRFCENLARGPFLYVDDFVTDAGHRHRGHGRTLLDWITKWAEQLGCSELHLDSGVQRTGAHEFYEKQKMTFSSRHYSLKLKQS
jgi:GNAT superfamily N-acetyltransferase